MPINWLSPELDRDYTAANQYMRNQLAIDTAPVGAFGRSDGIPLQNGQRRDVDPLGNLLNTGAMISAPIPGVGDALGLAADARMYQTDPESRTWGNYAQTAMGLLPMVPSAAALYYLMNRGGDVNQLARAMPSQRGIVGGINAKTADLGALEKAKTLQASGAPREQVLADTGWWQGKDGKWRFEIDDSGASLKPAGLRDFHTESSLVRQSRMMEHPDLAEAYPDTGAIAYRKHSEPGAAYVPNTDTIFLPQDAGHPAMSPELRDKAVRSSALHELQHSIQGREGFAAGGSPNEFAREAMTLLPRKALLQDELRAGQDFAEWYKPEMGNDWMSVIDAYAEHAGISGDSAYRRFLTAFDDSSGVIKPPRKLELERLNIADEINALDITGHNQYQRLAGETESRAVEARRNMTAAERRARPFWMDFDVPESEQIVR